MKKKIYLSLLFSFLIIIITSLLIVKNAFNNIKTNFSKKYYNNTIKTYNFLLQKEKTFLKSIAEYLATSPATKKAYLTNNKQYIIDAFLPLHQSLYKSRLIDEMHFFKTPVKNFVAFSNLKLQEINLTNARRDILWVTTSLKPSVHFYICRQYPGLRATYPVIYNYHIYGSVSIGSNLINFKNMFDKLNMHAAIYLNDKILKNSLCPEKYSIYKKYPLYKGYRVIGDVYKINFNNKYETKKENIYVIIPVIDFFHQKAAYIVVKKNFSDTLNIIKKNALKKIISEILFYFFVFGVFFILFRYIYSRFNELQNILNLIKEKKFEQLSPKIKEKDEFDTFKNNLIDVAKDLSLYLNLLSNELQYYSKKAYIDELTSVYNRNFLQEKAEEIMLKYKLSKKPMAIIMFDIDDFKKINDTYGHDIGDLVLTELTKAVKTILRKEDIFIRYGGEEFLIILPDTGFKDAIKIAEKIKKHIENMKITLPDKKINITISLGVSELTQKDVSLFDAIKRADMKLYQAKNSGKNRVVY